MSRSRMELAGFTVAGALVLLLAAPLDAQGAAGEISGTVKDDSGAALPGVTVSLSGESMSDPLTRLTDAGGSYRFTAVPTGTYGLRFSREGFAPENRSGVSVTDGATTVQNATLRISQQATVTVSVDSGTTSVITHQARVSTSTQEGNPGDESALEDTTVMSQADLTIAQSDSVDPAIAGTALTYTLTVSNKGPSHARYVEVTNTPAAGVAFQSTAGCEEDPRGVPICTLGMIPAGGSKRYTVAVVVDSATTGVITNQASVGSQTVEVNPGDESSSEDTAVTSHADLAIAVGSSVDPVIAGSPLTYTMTVTNKGPSDAGGVVVAAATTLPTGVAFDSTTGCSEDPGGVPTCTLGTVPAGGSKRYTIAVATSSNAGGGVITNEVSVTSRATEVGPGDESASEDTAVDSRADLAIAASSSADPVIAGTPLAYTVTVTNNGPSDARDVEVTHTLPETGVTFDSTTGCAEDPGGIPTCTLGTIPVGASKRHTLAVTVGSATTGVITHQASASSSTTEMSRGDESTTEETAVDTRADLVLTNRDSVDPVIAGKALTYTVTVTNNGPSDARDVKVAGTLPAAVTFQSTAGCAEDEGPGGGIPSCTLGTIAAGSSKQYVISLMVNPDATGVISNQASVTSSTTEDRPGDESTAEPAVGGDPGPAQELTELVRAWARAWSEQRLDDYLRFYASVFRLPGGMSRDEWEAQRRTRILEPDRIDVRVSGIATESLGAGRARVSFDQDYRSDIYNDVIRKTLEVVREDGRWRILDEQVAE